MDDFFLTLNSDGDFDEAVERINAAWHEAFDREHAIAVLKAANIAPILTKALAEMTFEEWEDFIVNYLGS